MAARMPTPPGQLPLFADPSPPPPAPASSPFADRNSSRLRDWADMGVFLGTSSWKYPGWGGQVYNRKYASKRQFEDTFIAEYATLFPTVCADFALYDFPHASTMARIANATPEHFRLSLKVTDRITVQRYPGLPRFGAMAGKVNPDFLNVDLFAEAFVRPLEALGPKVGAVILEFSEFATGSGMDMWAFAEAMDGFLPQLPRHLEYGVEVRNRDFLQAPYLGVLARHKVAHVLNNWTRMPSIHQQLQVPGTLDAPHGVLRALLKPGRKYAEAVEKFQPYTHVQEENPELRQGLVESVERAVEEGRKLFAYVNNRAEGNAPGTIDAILEKLEPARGRRKALHRQARP